MRTKEEIIKTFVYEIIDSNFKQYDIIDFKEISLKAYERFSWVIWAITKDFDEKHDFNISLKIALFKEVKKHNEEAVIIQEMNNK